MSSSFQKEGRPGRAWKVGLRRLASRYPSLFRAAKFALGSGVGFLDTVLVLTLGTYALFGRLSAPSNAVDSGPFILLNIFAFVFGVSIAFFVSESLILKNEGREISYKLSSVLQRLGKFQLIFMLGNLAMVAVELSLLMAFGIPPTVGIIIGGIASFPIGYFFATRFIWKIKSAGLCDDTYDQGKLAGVYVHNPITFLPGYIVTSQGRYVLNVLQNRFDVFPAEGEDDQTKVEFELKIELSPEDPITFHN
jgi:putative flippase GtrA